MACDSLRAIACARWPAMACDGLRWPCLLIAGVWAAVICEAAIQLYYLAKRHARAAALALAAHEAGGFSEEAYALYELVLLKLGEACSACAITVRGCLLVAPPLFYYRAPSPHSSPTSPPRTP